MDSTTFFWFRRDLRLSDNIGLLNALDSSSSLIPVFIFDDEILAELKKDDARVTFIYDQLEKIHAELLEIGSSLLVKKGNPDEVWKELISEFHPKAIFTNKDYEPYAIKRDLKIQEIAKEKDVDFHTFKDQVIFEESEVVKDDGSPYTVFTPFKKKWLAKFDAEKAAPVRIELKNLHQNKFPFPSLDSIGFERSKIQVKDFNFKRIGDYDLLRDYPDQDATSYLSPHLRFGTVGIREIVAQALDSNATFLSELIWREFFMQILFHYPKVVDQNFRSKYDGIQWRNNEAEFELWKKGETGYPMVDAGMRQLNKTGYMHNRVRMVVASFLCKHLLIDWRWGEAYFAEKLLDYDLSANNGNWQWAAGTGCDAAPYFRIFNPTEQQKKFDPKGEYVRTWVEDLDELTYPNPIVDHKEARERALKAYKQGISEYENF